MHSGQNLGPDPVENLSSNPSPGQIQSPDTDWDGAFAATVEHLFIDVQNVQIRIKNVKKRNKNKKRL